jgi:protoheme IX farnesyltransferase
MSDATQTYAGQAFPKQTLAKTYQPALGGEVKDYVELLKPRVMFLVVFTGLVGLVAAPVHVNPVLGFASLLCIAVGSGAAGCLNMWYDADIDAKMARTAARPLPQGKIEDGEALAFGAFLAVASVVCLGLMVNYLSGLLLAVTIGFYVFVYTMWLKRSTPQNIVIGGAAGAMPPLVGWAAATGSIALAPIVLFLIIFIWTPPHFWALALVRSSDYERAGVPMLPVTHGADETRRQIMIYSIILAPLGCVPAFIGLGGPLYALSSVVLGGAFLFFAWRCWRVREGEEADRAAKHLFGYSILYLFLLFAVLLVEQGFGIGGGPLPALWTL